MNEPAWVPVSMGELFDKISILQIKQERMKDAGQLANVRRELALLDGIAGQLAVADPAALSGLREQLLAVNARLWDLENTVRALSRAGEQGASFVAAARFIYDGNDRRAAIKREINRLLGSAIVEEKDHSGG